MLVALLVAASDHKLIIAGGQVGVVAIQLFAQGRPLSVIANQLCLKLHTKHMAEVGTGVVKAQATVGWLEREARWQSASLIKQLAIQASELS